MRKPRERGEPPYCKCGCGERTEWDSSRTRWKAFALDHFPGFHRLSDEEKREKQRARNARAIAQRREDEAKRDAWARTMREYRAKNIERYRAKERERYARDPRRRHQSKLGKFGITLDELEAMSAEQGHLCAICRRPQHRGMKRAADGTRRLDIDHDHQTGAIRGLLCSACNRGIGLLGDDPERLEAAVAYLRHHGASGSP